MPRALTFAGFVGVLVCATFAGCAFMPSPAGIAVVGPLSCTQGPPILITKIEPNPFNSSKRDLTLDHQPAGFCAGEVGTVRWLITGSAGDRYVFTYDGIGFKDWPPDGTTSIPGKKQFDVIFPALSPSDTTWKYGINFREEGNSIPDSQAKKWRCDPTVVSYSSLVNAKVMRTPSPPATITCDPLP